MQVVIKTQLFQLNNDLLMSLHYVLAHNIND